MLVNVTRSGGEILPDPSLNPHLTQLRKGPRANHDGSFELGLEG